MSYPVIFLVIIAVAIIDVVLRQSEDTFIGTIRFAISSGQSNFDKILNISRFLGIYVFIISFLLVGGILHASAGLAAFILMEAGHYSIIGLAIATICSACGIFTIRWGISFLFFREFLPTHREYELKFVWCAK